ncbi:protein SPT2 homolog [Sapajus apella]|uniref:Protein SPT2 homolog n=1 Tax=Sapajus apella TaxID=9515 RepID=A0A6J3ERV7_SAPAP|nr:protein SPT2 homolog [Sapajus apella]
MQRAWGTVPDPLPLGARAARLRPHCFPEGGQQLGRGLSLGGAGAGPPVGSASAPHKQSGQARRAEAAQPLREHGGRGGWRGHSPEGRRRARAGRARDPGPRRAGAPRRERAVYGKGATSAASTVGPGSPAARAGGWGPASILRPRGAGTGPPGQAAVLGGWGSDAAAFPFSCPRPFSAASSSSLGPRRRRRLSLGALQAASLHQGRADPQGPSREVRGCCRFPQLLVAIFNPPPPPPPAFSTSRWLPD